MKRNSSKYTTSIDEYANANSKKDRKKSVSARKESEATDAFAETLKCNCKEHPGTQMLNKEFNLNIEYIFECLFGQNEVNKRLIEMRKISDVVGGEWKDEVENDEAIRVRKLEYNVAISGSLVSAKSCKTLETDKILVSIPNNVYVYESESMTVGVPYSEYFKVLTRFCLTRTPNNYTRVMTHYKIVFVQKPIYVVRKIIEKTCHSEITQYFADIEKLFNEEALSMQNKTDLNNNSIGEIDRQLISSSQRASLNSMNNVNTDVGGYPYSASSAYLNSDNELSSSITSSSHSSLSSISFSDYNLSQSIRKKHSSSNKKSFDGSGLDQSNNNTHHSSATIVPSAAQLEKSQHRKSENRSTSRSKQRNHRHLSSNGPHMETDSQRRFGQFINEQIDQPNQQFFFVGFRIDNRLFINIFLILMVTLIAFNFMLYLKLREIETLANFLKKRSLMPSLPAPVDTK